MHTAYSKPFANRFLPTDLLAICIIMSDFCSQNPTYLNTKWSSVSFLHFWQREHWKIKEADRARIGIVR